ncbi:MAG: replication-associated recombination protein A [Alphaproteobacteria bacterium]|nr:MAG: replication-associated recombination protein A [Alphaproteobacteria bacterium]
MSDLFGDEPGKGSGTQRPSVAPLAERLRPRRLEDILGQEHLTAPGAPLARMMAAGSVPSLLLWGPPGTGKTTIARLLADLPGYRFQALSAIESGVRELKRIFSDAERLLAAGNRLLLFVDEIHRFNRAQQDAFLRVVEEGVITLVGATTENPSFVLNAALLSRLTVLVLRPLGEEALEQLLARAEEALGTSLPLGEEARTALVAMAAGDARALLNMAELVAEAGAQGERFTRPEDLARLFSRRPLAHDRDRDQHYNLISAFHKAVRGSDVDAALYWLARMLEAGEDPRYITRRMIRIASEDVGLAAPQALEQALAADAAYERLGSPEGELALFQAAVFLASAPKSNALYRAEAAARALARRTAALPPPMHSLNAPTKLMRSLGYGEGYVYDHDAPDAFAGLDYFPEKLAREQLYHPTSRGFEARIAERLASWQARRARAGAGAAGSPRRSVDHQDKDGKDAPASEDSSPAKDGS